MIYGLINLVKSKWFSGTGRQVILKGDFLDLESAVLQSFGLQGPPAIEWIDASSIKVPATVDDIASVMLSGFPSILHPGRFISAGLTDGKYRENTADVIMDFDLASNLWGIEKASQHYIVYALAGNADTAFTIKAMPFMRVKSQASQVISLGTLGTPATGIGYGFTTDELAGGQLYFLSGASKGLVRSITANNNDSGTGGTITYGGDAVTLAQGDWLAVLPPTNFRWLGSIFNNASSNIRNIRKISNRVQVLEAQTITATGGNPKEDIRLACPLATEVRVMIGVGAAGELAFGPPDNITDINSKYSNVNKATHNSSIALCRYVCSGSESGYLLAYSYPAGCGY